MVRLSATDAARGFSEVLNRVAAGDEVEVVRNGAPVAVIAAPPAPLLAPDALRALLASAPPSDPAFADDVRALREAAGLPPERWPS